MTNELRDDELSADLRAVARAISVPTTTWRPPRQRTNRWAFPIALLAVLVFGVSILSVRAQRQNAAATPSPTPASASASIAIVASQSPSPASSSPDGAPSPEPSPTPELSPVPQSNPPATRPASTPQPTAPPTPVIDWYTRAWCGRMNAASSATGRVTLGPYELAFRPSTNLPALGSGVCVIGDWRVDDPDPARADPAVIYVVHNWTSTLLTSVGCGEVVKRTGGVQQPGVWQGSVYFTIAAPGWPTVREQISLAQEPPAGACVRLVLNANGAAVPAW